MNTLALHFNSKALNYSPGFFSETFSKETLNFPLMSCLNSAYLCFKCMAMSIKRNYVLKFNSISVPINDRQGPEISIIFLQRCFFRNA